MPLAVWYLLIVATVNHFPEFGLKPAGNLPARAQSSKPSAARQLVRVLDELHKGSARTRRGSLKLVRAMTDKGGDS